MYQRVKQVRTFEAARHNMDTKSKTRHTSYVLPACRKMAGFQQPMAAIVRAVLPAPVRLDPRPEYQRVILSWHPGQSAARVENTGNQISSRLQSLRAANGLLMLPPKSEDKKELTAGAEVDALVIGPLLNAFPY